MLTILQYVVKQRTSLGSLPNTVTAADSLASFKSRLKTHLFNQTVLPAAKPVCHARAPVKVQPYGALKIYYYYSCYYEQIRD